jgi:hypothetical protein
MLRWDDPIAAAFENCRDLYQTAVDSRRLRLCREALEQATTLSKKSYL